MSAKQPEEMPAAFERAFNTWRYVIDDPSSAGSDGVATSAL
jgi:hypothetical protein